MYSEAAIRERLGIATMALKRAPRPAPEMHKSGVLHGLDWERLAHAVNLGIKKIEFGADYGAEHFPYQDADRMADFVRRLRRAGATAYSVHSPYGYLPVLPDDPDSKWSLNEADPEKRRLILQDAERLFAAMSQAEARVVVLHLGFWDDESLSLARELLSAFADMAAPHGIWLGVEGDECMHGLAALVAPFPFPQVGITWDTGHAGNMYRGVNILSDPANIRHVLKSACGRVNHLHLSDASAEPVTYVHAVDGKPRGKRSHLPPTVGTSDWAAKLSALEDAGYPGAFMFEVTGLDKRSVELVADFPRRVTERSRVS